MAEGYYPLQERYTQFWYAVDVGDIESVHRYVRNSLVRPYLADGETIDDINGVEAHITVINLSGQKYGGKNAPLLDVILYKTFDIVPTHIMIQSGGLLRIYKFNKLSPLDLASNLYNSAARTMQVAAVVAATFGTPDMIAAVAKTQTKIKKWVDPIWKRVIPFIELFQQSAATIEKYVNISLLEKYHKLGRVISPEYNDYWIDQENKLGEMSYKVFGDTATLQTYIHIAEMMFYDTALAAKADGDTARYEALAHGAELADKIGDRLDHYKNNPQAVWIDIWRSTFGDDNKYIAMERSLAGEEEIKAGAALGANIALINKRFKRLEQYMFQVDQATGGDFAAELAGLREFQNNYYDLRIDPVIRKLEQMDRDNEKIIAQLQADNLKRRTLDERSRILTSPPAELSENDKKQQRKQFTELFDTNILPPIESRSGYRVDIESYLGALFDE